MRAVRWCVGCGKPEDMCVCSEDDLLRDMHDRTGEAELPICPECNKNRANVMNDEDGTLLCARCWLDDQKATRPVKAPRKTEK